MDPLYLETAVNLLDGLSSDQELILLASAEHMVQLAIRSMTSKPIGRPPKDEAIYAYNKKWIQPYERVSKLENLLRLHSEVVMQSNE